MKLVSVNVGLPRRVQWKGKTHTTGIFKAPVIGGVAVNTLNLEGDGQADLSVHGGPSKAVYAYPAEHYAYWKGELSGMELPCGMFGENLTTEGLTDFSQPLLALRLAAEVDIAIQARLDPLLEDQGELRLFVGMTQEDVHGTHSLATAGDRRRHP